MGKTLLARCLGTHSYFGGLFNLDQFNPSAEYAVFDDLAGGMEFFHSYKQWMGGQYEFTVTDKYRKKQHIKFGKYTIYCSNTDPREDKGVDRDWLEGNCIFVYIDKPVFPRLHANTQSLE